MKPAQPTFHRAPSHALALEARMLFDAATVATAGAIADANDNTVQATGNQPPTLSASASGATLDVVAGGAVAVFSDAAASTGEASQRFSDLVLTVNSSGPREALVIDGTAIALQNGNGATRDAAYGYTVTTSGNQTTIAISIEASNNTSAAHVQTLVDGIRYQALDTSVDGGTRTITLTSIRDDGGTADGGQDTTVLAVSSTITLVNDTNRAPVIASSALPMLAQSLTIADFSATGVVYAADGKHAYVASADGSLATFEVGANGQLVNEQVLRSIAGLSSVRDMTLSQDGKHLYAISGATLVRLDIGADGTLSAGGSFASRFGNLVNVAMSADGRQVYASTQVSGLMVLARDGQSGALSELQRIDEGAIAAPRTRDMAAAGDYVFVVSGPSLVVMLRAADGTLSKLANGEQQTGIDRNTFPALAVSSDGALAFVAGDGVIHAHQLIGRDSGASASLLKAGTTAQADVNALSLSADGTRLYATGGDGSVTVYTVGRNGSLQRDGVISNVGGARAVAVAPDGLSVMVSGDDISRHTLLQSALAGRPQTIAAALSVSDANLDQLAGGSGNYQGASILIARSSGAQAEDRYDFISGNGLALSNGAIMRGDQQIATFSTTGGALTLAFTAAVSRAEATAALRQITYSNAGSHAAGTAITLDVNINDGELDSTSTTLAITLDVNTPPTLNASPVDNPLYTTSGVTVPLFNNASVNTGEAGQLLLALTVRVNGVAQANNEFLLVDGVRIGLDQDGSGTTASGLTYTYTRTAGSGALVLESSAGISSAAVQVLVNRMQYVNESGDALRGERQVQLAALTDNGGGDATAALSITSTITLALNNAPLIEGQFTPDARLFYFEGRLSGFNDHVNSLSVSADGKALYVISSAGSNNSGVQYLRVYSRDTSSGALVLEQSFAQGATDDPATAVIEVDGLRGLSTLTLSADGNHLYAAGYSASGSANAYALVLFTRAADGKLSYQGMAATQGAAAGNLSTAGLDAAVTEIVLSADGSSLYTINGQLPNDGTTNRSVIASFTRNPATGALTFIGAYTGGSAELGLNQPSGMAISGDGRSVYVSNASNGMISIFSRNTSTGVLSYSGVVNQASILANPDSAPQGSITGYMGALNDIVIAPDDRYVYVSSSSVGSVAIFARQADGSLVYAGVVNGQPLVAAISLRDMAMSADGKALYATTFGSTSILVFARDAASGALRAVDNIKVDNTVNHLAVSADGRSIYAGVSSFFPALQVLSASNNIAYAAASPVAFAAGLRFQDADFDASGSYQGTILSIERNGGANAADRFSFTSTSGLSVVDGKLMHNGSAIGEVSASAGKLQIQLTASVDRALANEVLQQLQYQHDGGTPPAQLTLAVTVSDGSKSAIERITLQANQAPVANGSYAAPEARANSPYSAQLPPTLFTDPEGDVLTWRVEGLPAGVSFDAASRTIGGTAASAGVHQLSIVVTDSAGNRSSISTTLTVTADPRILPTIGGDAIDLVYGGREEIWNADAGLNVLEGARDSVASSDGNYLYVVSVDQSGNASLNVLRRSADGRLETLQTLFDKTGDNSADLAGLGGVNRVVLSADQNTVYVIGGDDNTVLAFGRDAATGLLSAAGSLSGAALDGAITDIASRNGYLYLSAGDSLTVLRQDGATLSLLHSYREGAGGMTGLAGASRLLLSADGKQLYLSGNGSSTVVTVFAVATDGALTRSSAIERAGSENYIRALSLAADGKTLYAINNGEPATLEALSVAADGSLAPLASYPLDIFGSEIAVAADGRAVFVVGDHQIIAYTRSADGALTRYGVLGEDDFDNSFSALGSVTSSADGKHLYVSGTVGFNQALMTINLALPAVKYTEGNPAIVILPTGELSSPTKNTAGNYGGAVLTIARQNGAVADDVYGLLADNGLSLADGEIRRGSTVLATLVQENGLATVTFGNQASAADARQVLRQLTYSNRSNDPASHGERAQLHISFDDGSGASAGTDVQLQLTGINAPPVVAATVLNPTLQENGGFVRLFSNTSIDTVEAGQQIWNARLVINGAGPNEVIRYSGGTIRLVATSGAATLPGGQQYMVSVSGGTTTVTLFMNVGAAEAAAMIDSISYNNHNSGLSGTRTVSLTVEEQYAGGDPTRTTLSDNVTITLAGSATPNTAPLLQAPASAPAYTEGGAAIRPAAGVTVSDTQMDSLGAAGNYAGATLTLTLGAGASSLDRLGFVAGNGLALVGSQLQKDGVRIGTLDTARPGQLSITFDDDGGTVPTRADVQNALQQISYQSSERAPAASVALTITLADRQLVSAALPLQIAITAVNDAPEIGLDPVLGAPTLAVIDSLAAITGLGPVSATAISADGALVYVGDNQGALAVFSRDAGTGQLTYRSTIAAANGLGAIHEILLSRDGKSLYVIGDTDSMRGMAQFERASDGSLRFLGLLTDHDDNSYSFGSSRAMVESPDGQSLYFISGSSLVHLSRDSSSGALTFRNTLSDSQIPPYLWQPRSLTIAGDTLFVTNEYYASQTIIAYRFDAGGALALRGYIAGTDIDVTGIKHSAVSTDGSHLYLASANTIHLLRFDQAGNSFSYVGAVAGNLPDVGDLALSGDGRLLYASSAAGGLLRFAIDGERLQALTPLVSADSAALQGAGQIAVSSDGGVLVVGAGLAVLNERHVATPSYNIGGQPVLLAPLLSLHDAENDAAAGGNYQGASLVIGRTPSGNATDVFSFAGSSALALSQDGATILSNGNAIASFSQQNGVLTIRFTAPASGAEARAVLRQISYSSSATEAASVALQLSVSDGAASTTFALDVDIVKVNQAPVAGSDSYTLAASRAGSAYSTVLPANLFNDPDGDTLSWRVSGLPDGLRFDPSTRSISGTPTIAGTANIRVTVSDPRGAEVSRNFDLVVQAADSGTPTTPTTPTTPVDPGTPTTPTTPVDPGTPTTPTTPVDPGTPTTPTTPVDPGTPTTPTTPVDPGTPTTPTTPVDPGTP
ncbi:MAG: beta-propeller fold lactonase family protein, partial [Duganella sp.]